MSQTISSMTFLIILSTILTIFSSFSIAFENDNIINNSSAYQVLQEYDFPVGLLPKGATGNELNKDTREFKVYLQKTCSFPPRNGYTLKYQPTPTAVISSVRFANMKGVSVKVLFFWLSVVEVVRVSHGQLRFLVGFASADFEVGYFGSSPQCGCGMHCDESTIHRYVDGVEGKNISSSLVSL